MRAERKQGMDKRRQRERGNMAQKETREIEHIFPGEPGLRARS